MKVAHLSHPILGAFPTYLAQVSSILERVLCDDFEQLVAQGLAGPAAPQEYRRAIQDYLQRTNQQQVTLPGGLTNTEIFSSAFDRVNRYTVDVQLFVDGQPSDLYAVFVVPLDGNRRLFLYDIRAT